MACEVTRRTLASAPAQGGDSQRLFHLLADTKEKIGVDDFAALVVGQIKCIDRRAFFREHTGDSDFDE